MNYEEFLEKYRGSNPLWCYTELVTIGDNCAVGEHCYRDKGLPTEDVCPFRTLLDFLKENSSEDVEE